MEHQNFTIQKLTIYGAKHVELLQEERRQTMITLYHGSTVDIKLQFQNYKRYDNVECITTGIQVSKRASYCSHDTNSYRGTMLLFGGRF